MHYLEEEREGLAKRPALYKEREMLKENANDWAILFGGGVPFEFERISISDTEEIEIERAAAAKEEEKEEKGPLNRRARVREIHIMAQQLAISEARLRDRVGEKRMIALASS